MYFSFEHYIVPKVYKTEEDIKASAVYLNRQDMCSDSPSRMKKMAGSSSQDIALILLTSFKIWLVHNCQKEEDHLNIQI